MQADVIGATSHPSILPAEGNHEPPRRANSMRKPTTISAGTDGVPLQVDGEPWTGMLEFLNRKACYTNQDSERLRRSNSLLGHHDHTARRHRHFFWCLKRVQAAFRKPVSFQHVDPTKPWAGFRTDVGRVVMSPLVQTLVMSVILIDVGTMVYKFCVHPDATFGFGEEDSDLYSDEQVVAFLIIDWIVLCVLGSEVLGRITYLGRVFTHSILNLMEFCLIPLMLFELVTRNVTVGVPMPVLRACRPIVRSINLVAKAARGLTHAVQLRHILQEQVAGTHKRFQTDGFNLDLCYVSSQLIAMGRPALGRDALFNNPMGEVARFFTSRHPNRFIVINTSENYDYPGWPLHHRIIRFPIRTHSVPNLADLWELCQAMKTFLDSDEQNVVAVHGYSGGGQVGMVIAAFFLFSGGFRQATAAMSNYERTRTAAGAHETVQGFDSASQRRFIEYFCSCVHEVRAVPEPPIRARLQSIRVLGLDLEQVAGVSARIFLRGTSARSGKKCPSPNPQDRDHDFTEELELQDEDEDEAVMLMVDEETVLRMAAEEKRKQKFDARDAGCHPLPGIPFLDTMENATCTCKGKVVQQQVAEDILDSGNVLAWKFENVDFAGEVCVEIHARDLVPAKQKTNSGWSILHRSGSACPPTRFTSGQSLAAPGTNYRIPPSAPFTEKSSAGSVATGLSRSSALWGRLATRSTVETSLEETEPASKMLFSASFHTSFLEQSQSMSMRRELGDNTIGITLGRFNVDKAADAPRLASYGASFQLQLVFRVDGVLDGRPRSTKVGRNSRTDDEEDGKRLLKELHPPDEESDVSDFYSIGWLTWCVRQLWPFTEVALVKLVREVVEPLLQESVPSPLKNIHFSTFNLGTATPELGPMVASQRSSDSQGLQLDLIIKYRGDANILMDAGIAKLGVNHIELIGTLSMLFDPIVDNLPIVGGMKLFFLNPPQVRLKFVGLAELAHMPFMQRLVEDTIQDALADVLVLPNVLCISWMPEVAQSGDPSAYLTNRLPTGVLRVEVIEAEGFSQEHKLYVTLKFGATSQKTRVSQRTSQPKWNEICDLLLYDLKQTLWVEAHSSDYLTGDKLLGKSVPLEVGNLLRSDTPWIRLDPPSQGSRQSYKHAGSSIINITSQLLSRGGGAHTTSMIRVHIAVEMFTLSADPLHLPAAATATDAGSQPTATTPGISSRPSFMSSSPPRVSKRTSVTSIASIVQTRTMMSATRSYFPPKVSFGDGMVDNSAANVALLVCDVKKGRLPPERVAGATFCVRVGSAQAERKCMKSDETWKSYVDLTDAVINTIEVLVREGFSTERIAHVLKEPEALVSKVMAHCLGFNVDLPQHVCVLVSSACLGKGKVELEIKRKGRIEAMATIPLSDITTGTRSNNGVMKVRRLVSLSAGPSWKASRKAAVDDARGNSDAPWSQNRFDLDVELQLFVLRGSNGSGDKSESGDEDIEEEEEKEQNPTLVSM